MPEIGLKIILVEIALEMFETATKRQREWISPESEYTGFACMSWKGALPRRFLIGLMY